MSRRRADGVAHQPAALGFVDERLPVQHPGEVGLRGGCFLLGLEVVEGLLEEGAKGSLVGMRIRLGNGSVLGLFVVFCSQVVLGEFEVEDGGPLGYVGWCGLFGRQGFQDFAG